MCNFPMPKKNLLMTGFEFGRRLLEILWGPWVPFKKGQFIKKHDTSKNPHVITIQKGECCADLECSHLM